jgi:murein DD-endopeptidase
MEYADLLSARYKEGGRGPDFYDCWGLAAECLKRQGVSIHCSETPQGLTLKSLAVKSALHSGNWRTCEPIYGSLVAFKIYPPYVSHIGIVMPDGRRFLHIGEGVSRPTVVSLNDPNWFHRIAGFYRYIGASV